MMEAIRISETLVKLIETTRRCIPQNCNLHSYNAGRVTFIAFYQSLKPILLYITFSRLDPRLVLIIFKHPVITAKKHSHNYKAQVQVFR